MGKCVSKQTATTRWESGHSDCIAASERSFVLLIENEVNFYFQFETYRLRYKNTKNGTELLANVHFRISLHWSARRAFAQQYCPGEYGPSLYLCRGTSYKI